MKNEEKIVMNINLSNVKTLNSAELVPVAKLMLLMGARRVRGIRCHLMKIFHPTNADTPSNQCWT